jgi:tRNA threonylcarbamoyladenosine biosynthesis protein TsaB
MFTSLRVGLSLAKGLALAHRIPVVAVNTLDVIGISVAFIQDPVLVVINAYRGELYAALFRQGQRMTDYLLTTPREAMHMVQEDTIIIGSGTDLFANTGRTVSQVQAQLTHADVFLPTAAKVISAALPRIHKGAFDNSEILEPYYIKKTDAERNYHKNNAV